VSLAPSYSFGAFLLSEGVLYRDGQRVALTPKVMETLQALVAADGRLVSKNDLMKSVWPDTFVDESSLTSNISILRKTLGTNSEGCAYIETIPKRGYRFIAAAPESSPSSAGQLLAPAPQDPPAQRLLPIAWAATAALALLFGSLLVWRHSRSRTASPQERITVAVLPVQNLTGDPAREYMADGLTEEIIAQLSRFNPHRLSVIARTSSMAYKTTGKTAQQIGSELHAGYLVESSMREANGAFRITVQLVEVQNQSPLWSAEFTRSQSNLISLQDEIAQAIALQVRVELAQNSSVGPPTVRPLVPDAYLAYLEGRYYWNQRSPQALELAILRFQRAIRLDPSYALAYSGLADAYSSQCLIADVSPAEVFPKAKAAASKALDLDEYLAEAHNSLANILFWYDWNWQAAEIEFKRALDLNPGYAMAHQWYSMFLALMGREEEAIAENQKALALDPVSRIIVMESGLPYYFQHRFDDAIPRFQRALELDPNFSLAHCDLGWALQAKGDLPRAIAEFERAAQLNDSAAILSALGGAYAESGRRDATEQILRRLRERSSHRYVSPFFFASIYVGLHDYGRALELLEEAYQHHDWVVVWIYAGVRVDPIRQEPRFKALLHKFNFPATPRIKQ